MCRTDGGSASDSLLGQDIPVAISSRLPCDSVVSIQPAFTGPHSTATLYSMCPEPGFCLVVSVIVISSFMFCFKFAKSYCQSDWVT